MTRFARSRSRGLRWARTSLCLAALIFTPSLPAYGGQQPAPRILLLGDSLTTHYVHDVKVDLPDAEVARSPDLAKTSTFLLRVLDNWVQPKRWDVIHFNVGMWDMKYMLHRPGIYRCDRVQGHITTKPEKYRANLEAIVQKLQASGALIIFATTTPAPEGGNCVDPADIPRYNAIALEVMAEHHIIVDDLYTFMLPYGALHSPPTSAHFSPEGYTILGKHVAEEIQQEWAKKNP